MIIRAISLGLQKPNGYIGPWLLTRLGVIENKDTGLQSELFVQNLMQDSNEKFLAEIIMHGILFCINLGN